MIDTMYCTVATLGDVPCPEGLVAVVYFPGCPMSRRGCRLRIWALNRLLSQEMILAGLWTFCKGSFRPRKPLQDRQVTDPIQILASCGLCPRVSHVPEGLSPVVPPFTQSRVGALLRLRSRQYSTLPIACTLRGILQAGEPLSAYSYRAPEYEVSYA